MKDDNTPFDVINKDRWVIRLVNFKNLSFYWIAE